MAFTIDDLIQVVGGNERGLVMDYSAGEMAALPEFNKIEDLKKIFPLETFSDTASVAYVPSIFCHSYPARNKRGRMFLPRVLANSQASARDNLVNVEHEIADNGADKNEIIGHIKASAFQWEESASLPTEPIPMHALNALYLRHPKVVSILSEQERKKNWFTSMECGHDMRKACFHYRGEFIPVQDADPGMMECVKKYSVKPYKGHELSLCLGGEQGSVDFWGYAFTQKPADTGANVLGVVAAGREVASSGGAKKRYYPIQLAEYRLPEKTAEAASDAVDRKFNELASIGVIGQTDAAEDGHVHDVLSNGTIMPAAGHTHYLNTWSIVRGSQPAFTGHTGEHSSPYVEGRSSVSHLHLINIKLRGKSNVKTGDELDSDVSSSDSFQSVVEDIMEVKTMLGRVEGLIAKLSVSSGKTGEQATAPNGELLNELGKLKAELASTELETEIANRVKQVREKELASGDLVTKADHEAKVKEATDAAKAEADAVIKRAEKRQSRLEKVVALGVNLESTPFEDKPDETITARIDAIDYTELGDKMFDMALTNLKLLKEREELKASASKKETELKEAANAGAAQQKKKIPFLVGGSTGEEANAGAKAGSGSGSGGKKIGRHAFSS